MAMERESNWGTRGSQ